jgi:plastocyanin
LQNFPIVTAASTDGIATTVGGTLNSTASSSFGVDLYADARCDPSGFGEGETYLGSVTVTTDGSGNGSFAGTFPTAVALGTPIAATATDSSGNTSEFSPCAYTAPAGTTQVSVQDFFYSAAGATTRQGGTVQWNFAGPSSHTVTDSSGLGLYDSGPQWPGTSFAHQFFAAGTYPYESRGESTPMSGTVRVPVRLVPSLGPVPSVKVRWSSEPAPPNFTFDAQLKQPGSSTWLDWRTAQTSPNAIFASSDPLYVGPGTYSFRARLHNTANNATSRYSTGKSIALS